MSPSSDIWETEGCYDANPLPRAVQLPQLLCRRPLGRGIPGRSQARRLRRLGLRRARRRPRLRARRSRPIPATARSRRSTPSRSPIPSSPSIASSCSTGSTSRSAAAIDAIEGGQTFDTWRATAAYHIDETGTKLRASAGTGAKAATLYQRFSQFGFADLAPEQSFGFDAGVDQKLFGDRATVSATVFDTSYRDLIDSPTFPPARRRRSRPVGGCYYNVGRAEDAGRRTFRRSATLSPGVLRAKRDLHLYRRARSRRRRRRRLDAGLQLLPHPAQQGRAVADLRRRPQPRSRAATVARRSASR